MMTPEEEYNELKRKHGAEEKHIKKYPMTPDQAWPNHIEKIDEIINETEIDPSGKLNFNTTEGEVMFDVTGATEGLYIRGGDIESYDPYKHYQEVSKGNPISADDKESFFHKLIQQYNKETKGSRNTKYLSPLEKWLVIKLKNL